MKNLLVAGIAALAFVGTPALAADMPVKARPYTAPAAVYDWSGIYIGIDGGLAHPKISVENPAFPAFAKDFSFDKGIFGGLAGIQAQFGNVVLGVEGNVSAIFGKSDFSTCGSPPVLTPGGVANCRTFVRDLWSVGGRAGWALDRGLVYVTGGYASASDRFEAFNPANGALNEQARARVNGWYVGGGVDVAVYNNWFIGLDYRHYDFGNKDVSGTGATGVFLETVRFDSTADVVTARLGYKFNLWNAGAVIAKY